MNLREFIELAQSIHGNKYDYSKVEYKDIKTKVCIICQIHGEFWQTPEKHIRRKQGCPKCCIEQRANKRRCSTEEFIKKARQINGDKYDYSKVNYRDNSTKVCIICLVHGEFWMTPNKHLLGQGCPLCKGDKIRQKLSLGEDEFIKRSKEIHGNKYDYSKVDYINNSTKVCIICPKHGEFWQTPINHLNGKGCSLCNNKFRGAEYNLYQELTKEFTNIEIIYQYYNKDLFGTLSIDIFIPQYNIAIEYQGDQHFKPNPIYGKETFVKQIERDKRKFDICQQNNITLLYANFKKATKIPNDYFGVVYRTTQDVVNKVKDIIDNKKESD